MEEIITEFGSGTTYDDDGNEEESDSFMSIMTIPTLPFLILEHDVAPNGSIRNILNIQKMGNTLSLVDEYILFPLPIPSFREQPSEFIHRAYLGAAIYSKFTMVQENEPMYENIIRSAKKKNQARH